MRVSSVFIRGKHRLTQLNQHVYDTYITIYSMLPNSLSNDEFDWTLRLCLKLLNNAKIKLQDS